MRRRRWWAVTLALTAALVGCSRPRPPRTASVTPPSSPSARGALSLTSPTFADGQRVPRKYTADGDRVSPPLTWTAPPPGTAEWVLIMFDPDAPGGVFYHWSLYGLAPAVRGVPENLPNTESPASPSGRQGLNSANTVGYYPPDPPGGKVHHYTFRLYALSSKTGLAPRATPEEVATALQGRVLLQAELVGTYQR